MADLKPLIDINKVSNKLLLDSFCDHPHDFYIAYDSSEDELIIRLTEPKGLTALYYMEDDYALIVDIDRMEIVGMELLNFTTKHMPSHPEIKSAWIKNHLADELVRFQKVRYTPKNQRAAAPQSLIYSALFNNACKEINTMMG